MPCSHHDSSPGRCSYCPPLVPPSDKVCAWCGRIGADLLVNRKHWYHEDCDRLLGMIS